MTCMSDSVELKFPVVAHHRLICDAARRDDAATAAAIAGVPGLKMCL